MPLLISQSMYPSGPEQYLLIGSNRLARTMYIGNNWKKIRIGMRCCFDSGSDPVIGGGILAPNLFMGVCSGTSSVYGDQYPSHSVGLRFIRPATLAFSYFTSSTNTSIYGSTATGVPVPFIVSYANGTTASVATSTCDYFTLWATASIRGAMMVDFIKNDVSNATDITCSLIVNRSDLSSTKRIPDYDLPAMVFYQQMQQPTPVFISHSVKAQSGNPALPINETCGSLDSVNISWDRSYPSLQIYDIAVHRFE